MFLSNTVTVLKCQTDDKKKVSALAWEIVFDNLKSIYGTNADLKLEKTEKGKPLFKAYPDFHFNISHSGDMAAVAFSDCEVGVDIEKIRPVKPKIPKKFFTEEEQKFIKNNGDFFYVWTRKEAYIKRSGEGLSLPLSSFDTLNMSDIKTFKSDGFAVSVCGTDADNFVLENRL